MYKIICGLFLVTYLFSVGAWAQTHNKFLPVKIEIVHSHAHNHDKSHKHHHSDEHRDDHKDEVPHSHEFSLGSPVPALVAPQFALESSGLVKEDVMALSFEAPLAPDLSSVFRPPIS